MLTASSKSGYESQKIRVISATVARPECSLSILRRRVLICERWFSSLMI